MNQQDEYFRFKCEKGLARLGLADKQEYIDRLDFEIKTICKSGFAGYFLIVNDFINWARRNDILVGPGRGSGAGSLACYTLGITGLDPIRWGLLFERFLNPDRVSMPDLDIDFEKRYRDKVIEYVTQKYGQERVAHIGTFNMMRAKAAVRTICRLLEHPLMVGDELSKLLLPPIHGKTQPLSASFEKVPEIKAYLGHGGTHSEILQWAEKVEDIISSKSVHASGIVISNESMLDKVPLFLGGSDEIATQWEMGDVERIGLIKFDFLGLDILSKIHICIDILKDQGINLDTDKIPVDDPLVFEELRAGNTVGIFQLEASSGMRDLLVQIRPTELEDLIALVAIFRPGPLESDYKDTYLAVRAGLQSPSYLVPELEPILKRTSGWLIYQEQIMEIAKQLCGYTGGQADELRKAVGKKKLDLMQKHESKFKEGWIKNGLPENKVDQLWTDMVAFASYGFNRSHAAAYALITYQTAYLKVHYPTEYMCAVMISEGGDQDDIIKSLAECRRLGISVLPPDINESRETFYIDSEKNIRFGLGPIKNLGESPVSLIIEMRKEGQFKSLRDFCERVDLGTVNRLKLESLIKAGAFDQFGPNRASMLAYVDIIWEYKKQLKAYESKLETYEKKIKEFEIREKEVQENLSSAAGKKLRPFKRPQEPEKPAYPECPLVDEVSEQEQQQTEHDLLGFYVSSHPLDRLSKSRYARAFNTIEDVSRMENGTRVTIAAVIANSNEISTKAKKKMASLSIEDLTGSIQGVIYPASYNLMKPFLEEVKPVRIEGIVEIIETETSRISKLVVRKLQYLDLGGEGIRQEKIDVTIPANKVDELINLLEKYAGTIHDIRVVLKLSDGTKIRFPNAYKIGNYKTALQKDLLRINNE